MDILFIAGAGLFAVGFIAWCDLGLQIWFRDARDTDD